jgi:hypothetical protein
VRQPISDFLESQEFITIIIKKIKQIFRRIALVSNFIDHLLKKPCILPLILWDIIHTLLLASYLVGKELIYTYLALLLGCFLF